jgi:hypothetical protein
MLAGMGVPDLRGGLGTPTFFTSADGVKPGESESVVPLPAPRGGAIATQLPGPRNPRTRACYFFDLAIHPDTAGDRVVIHSAGEPDRLEVRRGRWSDWLRVKFKTGLFQSVRGLVRFHLVRLAPVLELYASPVNFDPDAPPFPISSPPGYAAELAREIGLFHTTGMAEDHTGLNNERFDEAAYLAQCADVWREREAMMLHELARHDEGFFFCLFDTPDRVQHMFWASRSRDVIEEHYRTCDATVGRALECAGDDALVIVLSDHGFSSFRRGANLNTWLHEQGLLKLRPGDSTGDFFKGVDWSGTRAYALGLSGIYLNLQGREAQGIVAPVEAEALKSAIAARLTGLVDAERGQTAVRSVLTREQVYSGPYASESPDLVVNFAAGYRASWGTALGGMAATCFEDNVKKWSGDHIIDPVLVPGVLFMNRPFDGRAARLLDTAPTVLEALGVPRGPAMEGRSLFA